MGTLVNRLLQGFIFAAAVESSVGTGSAAPGDLYAVKIGQAGASIVRFSRSGVENPFAPGALNVPGAIAFDHSGNLYAADAGSNQVLKFTPTAAQSVFASGLNGPEGLAFDSAGNLFVTEPGNHDILKFTSDGSRTTFATGLTNPAALAFDSSGNLFVSDFGAGQILKFTPAGTKTLFAAGLTNPNGVALDRAGNLFVTDANAIYKFTSAGARSVFVAVSGTGVPAFDSAGNLFVISSANIIKFTPTGSGSSFVMGQYGALAFEPVLEKVRNISARGLVGTGNNVLIGGFILGGNALANNGVVVRAIGPSLAHYGITNPLPDPVLELHNASGALITSNDNWQQSQATQIQQVGFAPADPRESAIYATLPAGNFTAIVRGKGTATGVALVEIYSIP